LFGYKGISRIYANLSLRLIYYFSVGYFQFIKMELLQMQHLASVFAAFATDVPAA